MINSILQRFIVFDLKQYKKLNYLKFYNLKLLKNVKVLIISENLKSTIMLNSIIICSYFKYKINY